MKIVGGAGFAAGELFCLRTSIIRGRQKESHVLVTFHRRVVESGPAAQAHLEMLLRRVARIQMARNMG